MDANEAFGLLELYKSQPNLLKALKRSASRENLLRYIEALEILPLQASDKMFSDHGLAYVTIPYQESEL